jgi:WhiB family transcriptional regulator, redox-sensing transcriptional regulator
MTKERPTMQALDLYPQDVREPERDLPCVAAGPELYFSESPRELETAKRLCRPCPLRAACLAGAIERREPWGVWGGEVFVDGRPVPFKRSRGRPRKHPLPPRPLDAEEAEAC